MSRNKRRGSWLGGLMAMALLMGACWAGAESLMPENLRVPEAVNNNTALVRRDSLIKTASGSATVVYPKTRLISLEEGEGIFVSFAVRKGAAVKAGDVLATFTRADQAVRHETLRLNLERAEQTLLEGLRSREEAIRQAQVDFGLLTDAYDQQIALLQIQRLELERDRFALEQQRSVDSYAVQLEELQALLNNTAIIAPFDGVVDSLAAKLAGDVVRAGETLVTLYAPEHVLLRVSDSNGAFRFGMDVTLQGGNRNDPTVFSGRVVAASNILPYEVRDSVVFVHVEDTATALDTRSISASCETIYLEDVLLVNRSALTMQGGLYYAQILEEDMVQKRYINTSSHRLTDLWVLQGLSEGQVVLID